MKNLKIAPLFLFLLLFSCVDEGMKPHKDLEIVFIDEDFAEFWIYDLSDSSLIISDIFDLEYVQSLHYNDVPAGAYYLEAKSGRKNKTIEFSYNGGIKVVEVEF